MYGSAGETRRRRKDSVDKRVRWKRVRVGKEKWKEGLKGMDQQTGREGSDSRGAAGEDSRRKDIEEGRTKMEKSGKTH